MIACERLSKPSEKPTTVNPMSISVVFTCRSWILNFYHVTHHCRWPNVGITILLEIYDIFYTQFCLFTQLRLGVRLTQSATLLELSPAVMCSMLNRIILYLSVHYFLNKVTITEKNKSKAISFVIGTEPSCRHDILLKYIC